MLCACQDQKIRLLWAVHIPLEEETEIAMKMLGKMSKSEWLTHRQCRNTSDLSIAHYLNKMIYSTVGTAKINTFEFMKH